MENKKEDKNKKGRHQKDKKEKKADKKVENKKLENILVIVIYILALITFATDIYYIYGKMAPKFKDITIEIGYSEELNLKHFVTKEKYIEDSKILTDLSTIDLNKVGEYDIELMYKQKNKTVKLYLVDTTAPEVKFQDITRYIGYEINAEDFILEKSDLSEMYVEVTNIPEITEFGKYPITIVVKDKFENVTSKECILTIDWLKYDITLELGTQLTKEDILMRPEEDAKLVSQSELDRINKSPVGDYTITLTNNGIEYVINIKIQDTMPPELELKDVTIYDDERIDKSRFIVSCKDASKNVETTLLTQIDYSKIGTQVVTVEAKDEYGNKIEKQANLTIRKDKEGPVFSGLKEMTVAKNSTIDYRSGVKAVDAKDGNCEFTVDTSKVNIGEAGTYYAIYNSKDTKGNTTTTKRKINVKHNQEDTNNKFNEFYNTYLAGKDAYGIISTIRSEISYNSSWGEDDPVWYGLTNRKGNCYVHVLMAQKALTKAGISNQIVKTTDGTHYWNLVNVGGVWRHYDSTPGNHLIGPATDDEKFASSAMQGRDWNRSAYPEAK